MNEILKPLKGKNSPTLGPDAVMIATPHDLKSICRIVRAERIKKIWQSAIYEGRGDFADVTVAGPFLGAPQAVMILEQLISWGVERIILMGWCGAVSSEVEIGDVILANAAFIDEGTSSAYDVSGDVSYPDPKMLLDSENILRESFAGGNRSYHKKAVWTTDAMFRETVKKVEFYRSKGAVAVEMETSAVFSAAGFRGKSACTVLTVSDDLSDFRWKPGFSEKRFIEGREAACEAVANLLSNGKNHAV